MYIQNKHHEKIIDKTRSFALFSVSNYVLIKTDVERIKKLKEKEEKKKHD